MTNTPRQRDTEFSLSQLLPNVLTVMAICAGLSAVRFAVQGNFSLAVQLVLVAGVLDGLDGRIARLMGSDSKIGAELDSLADFLNFGVVPPLIVYFWGLRDIPNVAWIFVMIFAVCAVMRLARFNVSSKSDDPDKDNAYFEGVPSPAGAMLVMLPIYLSFATKDATLLSPFFICVYMGFVGFLLISRIPTWSFKTTKISRRNAPYFLIGVGFFGAVLLSFAWHTLVAMCLAYVAMVIWAWARRNKV